MNADFPVILDACVLANQRVTDLLLRLAETPRLYLPFWSKRILDETDRTLKEQLGWPEDLVAHRREQITTHFPEALVEGFEPIEACVTNDPKDRHVLAAAIRGKCEVIEVAGVSPIILIFERIFRLGVRRWHAKTPR